MSKIDLSANKNGSITLYVGGRKVMAGTLAEITAHLTGADAPVATPKKPKKERSKSRSQRWSDAASAASAALEELIEVQQESALGEKLDAVCDIDLQSALDTVQEAESADLPLGFGRD